MIVNDNFLEAKEVFLQMQSNVNTRRAYANDIRHWEQFVRHVTLDDPIPAIAVAFKNALENNYSPSTAQRIWCTVAAFYGWMKGVGRTEATPFHGIKSPKRPSDEPPDVPTDDEIARLLNACEDGSEDGERAKVIFELMLNGLRAQEVCDARSGGLFYDNSVNAWMLSFVGKGDKYRTVALNSQAQEALLAYRAKHDEDWLVPAWWGGKLHYKSIYRILKKYADKAGVPNLHPHALRHHYATRLARGRTDLFTLQRLMGHVRADTTQRYISLDNRDLVAALDNDPMHNPEVRRAPLRLIG